MRVLFSKLLTSGYKEMRLFTTNYILTLMENNTAGIESWIPSLLIAQVNAILTQMFDPAPTVSEAALSIVRESTKYPAFMRGIILSKPDYEYLASCDSQILIKFLEDEEGFTYLLDAGFVEKEAKYWVDVFLS
jgi:rapamycin-insensitive companion of mTOR